MKTWNKEKIIHFLDTCQLKRPISDLRIVSASDKDAYYLGYGDLNYDGIPITEPTDPEVIGKLFEVSLSKSISSIKLHSLCDGVNESDEILVKTVERKDGRTNIDADVIEAFIRLFEKDHQCFSWYWNRSFYIKRGSLFLDDDDLSMP